MDARNFTYENGKVIHISKAINSLRGSFAQVNSDSQLSKEEVLSIVGIKNGRVETRVFYNSTSNGWEIIPGYYVFIVYREKVNKSKSKCNE